VLAPLTVEAHLGSNPGRDMQFSGALVEDGVDLDKISIVFPDIICRYSGSSYLQVLFGLHPSEVHALGGAHVDVSMFE
jgi:hypothetical protein